MRLLIKAIDRRVKRPGIKGGKYWIDRKGNVRYDIKGVVRPKSVDMASEMFMNNIKYYVGMAKNVANKFNIGVEYIDSQPVNDFADILAAGRIGAIKGYIDYFKAGYKNIDLKMCMRKRAVSAMYNTAYKLKNLVPLSYHDSLRLSVINKYKERYYAKNGMYPTAENIAKNISMIKYKAGKEYDLKTKKKIIERLCGVPLRDDIMADPIGERIKEDSMTGDMMGTVKKLRDGGKIKDVDYKIIQMYLGIGKYKMPLTLDEISNKLGKDRRYTSNRFVSIKQVLKPHFEKYRHLLEKSTEAERTLEFIREVLNFKHDGITKSIKYILKSHVKAHVRKTKTGKIVNVRDYQNIKTKQTIKPKTRDKDNERTLKKNVRIIEHKNYNTKKIITDKGYTVCTYTKVPKIIGFKSRMINDMNQNLCGGWSINFDIDDQKLTLKRVLEYRKPMGILVFRNKKDLKTFMGKYKIDKNKFDVSIEKDGDRIEVRISSKGKLKDLFDLKTLKKDYADNGIEIDISSVGNKEIKDYSKNWDAQNDNRTEYWETGLILGYPVENTISICK